MKIQTNQQGLITASFPTLYTRNSNGKINEWSIKVVEKTEGCNIIIAEGELEGIKHLTGRMVTKGKNLGKMNETNVWDQSTKQAASRWEDKRKKGYKSLDDLHISSVSLGEADTGLIPGYTFGNGGDFMSLEAAIDKTLPLTRTDKNNLSKPMKAQPYFKDDGSVRITFPCYGQPKLNGFRVMARWEEVETGEGLFKEKIGKVIFRSKEGLRYDILEHIEKEFTEAMFKLDGNPIAYDGEMYIPGEILSEISSAVRKRNAKTELIKFFIFDVAIDGETQTKRINMIEKLGEYIHESGRKNIVAVPTVIIRDDKEAQGFTDQAILEGYEGGIFRDRQAHYQFGSRPKTMVKLKRCLDEDFIITDIVGGENAPDLGILVCVTKAGAIFKANPDASHEWRINMLKFKHLYIGKKVQIKFHEWTKEGKPFHIKEVVIRDYE